MQILHVTNKTGHMNAGEKYHIYKKERKKKKSDYYKKLQM